MEALLEAVRKTWGHGDLRPLQREAMEASLGGRDALVVLPTGGGKSLCYQAPALVAPGLTVVVSPLISLMKDQVDGLRARGVPAAYLNSALGPAERSCVQAGVLRGEFKLLFVAPERFSRGGFDRALQLARVRAFAVDEAHCVSHWGHDFRAEYGRLVRLKEAFPGVPVHAFTATATPRVRADIIEGLRLLDPAVLVGDFFRPNLFLRVAERTDPFEDVVGEVLRRPGQAGIVYAIRRAAPSLGPGSGRSSCAAAWTRSDIGIDIASCSNEHGSGSGNPLSVASSIPWMTGSASVFWAGSGRRWMPSPTASGRCSRSSSTTFRRPGIGGSSAGEWRR